MLVPVEKSVKPPIAGSNPLKPPVPLVAEVLIEKASALNPEIVENVPIM